MNQGTVYDVVMVGSGVAGALVVARLLGLTLVKARR